MQIAAHRVHGDVGSDQALLNLVDHLGVGEVRYLHGVLAGILGDLLGPDFVLLILGELGELVGADLLQDAVAFQLAQQVLAGAQAVEGTDVDEVGDRTQAGRFPGSGEVVVEVGEGPCPLNGPADRCPHAAHRVEAVADALTGDDELALALVDVRRQDRDAPPTRLAQVLVDVVGVGLHQGDQELAEVVVLRPDFPGADDGVAHRVAEVEGVAARGFDGVPNLGGGGLGAHGVRLASDDVGLHERRVGEAAGEELLLEGEQLLHLLLADHLAQGVGLVGGEPGQLFDGQHQLLLVHQHAVGVG